MAYSGRGGRPVNVPILYEYLLEIWTLVSLEPEFAEFSFIFFFYFVKCRLLFSVSSPWLAMCLYISFTPLSRRLHYSSFTDEETEWNQRG